MLATAAAPGPLATTAEVPGSPLKVVCVGAHPDDPESGCAGTLARYAQLGHSVTVVYLTRGERGIPGKTNEQAAEIRTREAESACRIIGAAARFAGQIDGSADFTRPRVAELLTVLAAEKPHIVITHWPVDTHMDHQVASMCTIRAWMEVQPRPLLYFFEVNTGSQSLGFTPTVYVDVTPVLDKKKAALLAHVSQDGEEIWRKHHEPIASFRGREVGVTAAEGFFHVNRQTPLNKLL